MSATDLTEFATAACDAARWMAAVQDDDGCWRQGLSALAQRTPATYNIRSVVAAMASLRF